MMVYCSPQSLGTWLMALVMKGNCFLVKNSSQLYLKSFLGLFLGIKEQGDSYLIPFSDAND